MAIKSYYSIGFGPEEGINFPSGKRAQFTNRIFTTSDRGLQAEIESCKYYADEAIVDYDAEKMQVVKGPAPQEGMVGTDMSKKMTTQQQKEIEAKMRVKIQKEVEAKMESEKEAEMEAFRIQMKEEMEAKMVVKDELDKPKVMADMKKK